VTDPQQLRPISRLAARSISTIRARVLATLRTARDNGEISPEDLEELAGDMIDVVTSGVFRSARAQIRRDSVAAVAAGALSRPISRAVATSMAEGITATVMTQPFPGTSFSAEQRAASMALILGRDVNALLSGEPYRDVRRRAGNLANRGAGASVVAQMSRLVRTEFMRASRTATLAVATEAGAEYVYWRLSPAHVWQGGKEACEVIAEGSGDVSGAPPGASRRGLYRLGEIPAAPHPHCMCYLETLWSTRISSASSQALSFIGGLATVSTLGTRLSTQAPAALVSVPSRLSEDVPQVRSLSTTYEDLVASADEETAAETISIFEDQFGVDLWRITEYPWRIMPIVVVIEQLGGFRD
jgi:hypothetical protein